MALRPARRERRPLESMEHATIMEGLDVNVRHAVHSTRSTARQTLIATLVSLATLAGSAAAVHAQEPAAIGIAPAAKATLDQVGWIAGQWRGMLGDRQIEQHWMAPAGTSMVAMYRSLQQQRATLYELLAIEQDGDGLALRIKHFAPGPGMVGREAKEESIDHALVRVDGRTAVFEGRGAAGARVTFTSPNPDTLTIVVERLRDGKLTPTEFKYTRIKDQQ